MKLAQEAFSAKTPYYTDNPLTIRNVTSNMTITANFKFILKVDSFKEIMSNENGQLIYKADKKLYTFKPDKSTGGKSAFSISLASGKRYWNFRESGLELCIPELMSRLALLTWHHYSRWH